ncbi:MAG TPA: tripartite tricarboxylate transporter substrate-binding protein, partial [Burkholderiales bacterium]|nr:tripartite tricarboxylate transporter substrate-binding protein [Burkholderiales bacterium]
MSAIRIGGMVLLLAACMAAAVAADTYPSRPIRLIVPQAAGSSSDTVARLVAAELSREVGQQVVIDNRPGGALMIGLEMAARATPDGYTLGYGPVGGLAISPNVQKA